MPGWRLVIAFFKGLHQGSGLLLGVVSQSELIKDQDVGLDQTAYVVDITASGFGGMDFFEQKVDRE